MMMNDEEGKWRRNVYEELVSKWEIISNRQPPYGWNNRHRRKCEMREAASGNEAHLTRRGLTHKMSEEIMSAKCLNVYKMIMHISKSENRGNNEEKRKSAKAHEKTSPSRNQKKWPTGPGEIEIGEKINQRKPRKSKSAQWKIEIGETSAPLYTKCLKKCTSSAKMIIK